MYRLLRQVMLFVLSLATSVVIGWLLMEGERMRTEEQEGVSFQRQDDFTQIGGIGPVYAHALYALGIRTFGDLAHQDADILAKRLEAHVSVERIRHEDWIGQARELSRGNG